MIKGLKFVLQEELKLTVDAQPTEEAQAETSGNSLYVLKGRKESVHHFYLGYHEN